MALILQKCWDSYWFIFDELADPRTKSLPIVAKPYQGLAILGLYLMFVLKWGQQFMKNRKPFDIDKIMIIYNAFQVLACTYIFYQGVIAWIPNYKLLCQPVGVTEDPFELFVLHLVYCYFLIKIVDLLDTIFFVLRKKHNQITFLHVYHHTGMVMLSWGCITYFPGGHGTMVGIINSFVHMVMYGYYLLTVALPSIKKSVWFKKHVTQLQILQFFCCVIHMGALIFKTDCEYPRWVVALFLPQNLFMFILFTDFYIKTYVKKPKQKLNNSFKNGAVNKTETNNYNHCSNGNHVLNNGINNIKDTNNLKKVLNEDNNNELNKTFSAVNRKLEVPYGDKSDCPKQA